MLSKNHIQSQIGPENVLIARCYDVQNSHAFQMDRALMSVVFEDGRVERLHWARFLGLCASRQDRPRSRSISWEYR